MYPLKILEFNRKSKNIEPNRVGERVEKVNIKVGTTDKEFDKF